MLSRSLLTGVFVLALAAGCGGGAAVTGEVCGDEVVQGSEECDGAELAGATCASLNLGGGELACGGDCRFDVSGCDEQASCGNGVAEYPEECDDSDLFGRTCADLGFDSGTLSCLSSCAYDTAGCVGGGECGNDEVEGSEECDGPDLDGETCASLGLGGGTLGCDSSCSFNVAGCDVVADCGNGAAEYPEVCDGSDLDGTACTDLGFYGGALACEAGCGDFDTSGCEGSCGDDLINGPELCDGLDVGGETCASQGYYPGTLQCMASCDGYDFIGCGGMCGDGYLNGPELCDGQDFGSDSCAARGFYSGVLSCDFSCAAIDDSGCSETCGDGVINGPEACDGADLGGATCSNGATPRCAPDCSQVVCNLTTVLITEVGHGSPDWVELMNISANGVDLQGWALHWQGYDNGGNPVNGTLDLPSFNLGPGARVVIYDDFQGAGQPPDIFGDEIEFHVNVWWADWPGAVLLTDDASTAADYLRWGGPDFPPPVGVAWTDGPEYLPTADGGGLSLSRNPEQTDTDHMDDFCLTTETWGLTNDPCPVIPPVGSVLITEVDTGQPIDRIELYNASGADVDLEDYAIVWTYGGGWGITWLPQHTLAAAGYIAIIDDCQPFPGNPCPQVDGQGIHVENINWGSDAPGFCHLVDSFTFSGVDFVRWGGSTDNPQSPDSWTDGAGQPPAMPDGTVIGRSSLTDTDSGDDWCVMATPTFGAANSGCQ